MKTIDRALAVVLTVALELEAWRSSSVGEHRVALALCGPLVTVAVAVRRRYPTAVGLTAFVVAAVMQAFVPQQSLAYAIAWMCDVYACAVWSPRRGFVVAFAVYLTTALATLPFVPTTSRSVFFLAVSSLVILLVRNVIRARDRRATLAERERDLAAREAVLEERARIARELHDAIAHNVSMMVVQAGAERRTVEPGQTHDVLATVEQIGRSALTEMRRLVGMLRTDDREPLAPQPGLGDLPTLVSQVSDAGLPVELRVEGTAKELPAGLDLSAFRIVQEALTNALKHAGDARATVDIRWGEDLLEIEVSDDGHGEATRASGGHGLVGMRERAALYGGRFDAGHRPDGGFAVRVLLPTR